MRILTKSSFRYLAKHPWQVLLSMLGIALGVAVVVAIDLANQSASRAFELAMESVSGKATHQIIGGSAGLPDSLYRRLRVQEDFRDIAPVVEDYVAVVENGERQRTLLLLGVDPLAERPFRSYLTDLGLNGEAGIGSFLTRPGAVIMAAQTAADLGVETGDTLTIKIGGKSRPANLIGLLETPDERSRQTVEGLLITDIATAQELLEMTGRISRIDLILPEMPGGEAPLKRFRALLPESAEVVRAGSRSEIMSQMTRAFNLNLTALSLLALIVGMFLIYNTMTFSVVQRLSLIGLMRAVGVTRREIFSLVLGEALVLGLIGTLGGILLGILLGEGLVKLISQTINDLYFVVTVQTLELSALSLLKGLFLGLGATALAAYKPAREATAIPPRSALSRSLQEAAARANIPRLTVAGLIFAVAGVAILSLPSRSIVLSYSGILLLIVGFTLWTPLALVIMMKLLRPLMGKTFGMLGRMTTRDIVAHLSRTTVAIAALSMAVAATVGVGTMVGSFRNTVVHWLESRLVADVYISAPSLLSRRNDATLNPALVERIRQLPEVQEINLFRELMVRTPDRLIHVVGSYMTRPVFYKLLFKDGDPAELWPAFRDEPLVLVSEPYAYRNGVAVNDTLTLPTDRGEQRFRVGGIYYNYASEMGLVMMSWANYRRYWEDHGVSGVSVFARPGVDAERLIADIRGLSQPGEELLVRSNRTLRETSIAIFDRTFLITNVLRLLAIAVAFVGVLSALMALQLERSRELGILRANGLTPRELWGMVTLETGLMGLAAGILSLPMGTMLSYLLIYVINRRSFGWTLQFQFIPEIFVQALLLALLAALLAGLYPAWKMSRTSPALALREE